MRKAIIKHFLLTIQGGVGTGTGDLSSNATLIFDLQHGALSLGKQQTVKCAIPPQEAH
jgi:hypothetical protein